MAALTWPLRDERRPGDDQPGEGEVPDERGGARRGARGVERTVRAVRINSSTNSLTQSSKVVFFMSNKGRYSVLSI